MKNVVRSEIRLMWELDPIQLQLLTSQYGAVKMPILGPQVSSAGRPFLAASVSLIKLKRSSVLSEAADGSFTAEATDAQSMANAEASFCKCMSAVFHSDTRITSQSLDSDADLLSDNP